MVICRIDGGSGNQLLEFCAAYALAKELKKELILDISCVNRRSRGFVLDWFAIPDYPKLIHSVSEIKNIITWIDTVPDIAKYISIYDSESNGVYPVYRGLDNYFCMHQDKIIYLNGLFFNRDKYYFKYWEDIRKLLIPKDTQEEIEAFKEIIENKISVGVHLRRSDMLLVDWAVKLEPDYFRAVIAYCKEKFPDCIFCIFSDDKEYAKKILGLDSSYYYVQLMGTDFAAVGELTCLSLCTHRILSNSSTYSSIADAINWAEDRKTFRRLEFESEENVSTIDFSKRHIAVGKKDIEYYSKLYCVDNKCSIDNSFQKQAIVVSSEINATNCDKILNLIIELSLNAYYRDNSMEIQLLFKKFLCYIYRKQYEKALQNVFPLYAEYADNMEFNKGLREALHFIAAYEEEMVESIRLGIELKEDDLNKENVFYYKKLNKLGRKRLHFIMVPYVCNSVTFQSLGLVEVAQVLLHLGHKVSFIYEPGNSMEKEMIEKEGLIRTELGYRTGYGAYLYESVKDDRENFYNQLDDEEIVVVSRKAEMFIEKDKVKKTLSYVFIDFSDERDAETFYATEKMDKKELDNLYRKADIVLTKDNYIKSNFHNAIFWKDNDIDKWRLTEERLGLERVGRLTKRGIGMTAALIDALG